MKKIIIIAGVALVVVLGIAAALYFFVFAKKEPVEEPVVTLEFELDEMYSNIADPGKILKSKIVIQYTDEKLVDKFTNNKTRIVNDINQLYRTKTLEQLSAANGQERLRGDILEMVQEILEADPEQVTDVLFVDFIIQ